MAVIIRCRRAGANNDPCFRIVATDVRSPRDGKHLEILGWYDPKKQVNNFKLNLDRIEAWRTKGALFSPTVRTLVNKAKRGISSSTTKARAKPTATVPKETAGPTDASVPAAKT